MNLDHLSIDDTHKEILHKFQSWAGKKKRLSDIKGRGNKTTLPPDEFVKKAHIMHNLDSRIFPRKKSGLAQAILLQPSSEFGLEIDPNYSELTINYDFRENPSPQQRYTHLQKCMDNNIPFGLIMKVSSKEFLVLGLGRISSKTGNMFVIKSIEERTQSEHLKTLALMTYDKVSESEILEIPNIQWEDFIAKLDLDNPAYRPRTKTSKSWDKTPISINEIVNYANSTKWTIPHFQRYYVWDKDDVKSFLNSIFHEYYVGTILLWDVQGTEEFDSVAIDGVSSKGKLKHDQMVLDGQQRITSINYVVHAPDLRLKGEKTRIYFYLDFGRFMNDPESDDIVKTSKYKVDDSICFKKFLFPMYKLDNHDEWFNSLFHYIHSQTKETTNHIKIHNLLFMIKQRLKSMWDDFGIPLVVLPKSTSVDAVAEIFERINSTGKRLGTFDLSIVRLSRHDVKLRDLWFRTREKHDAISKSQIKPLNIYILESLALSFTTQKSCNKKDILNLYDAEKDTVAGFTKKWEESSEYINKSILLIQDTQKGFGAKHGSMPYESMIPTLASLLREIHVNFQVTQEQCMQKLMNWYWISVFGSRYSKASGGTKSSDFKDITKWFCNDDNIPKYISDFQQSFPNLSLRDEQPTSAIYKGVMCLLALQGGIDLEKRVNLESSNLQKDHIFPKLKFSKNKLVDSVLNMAWSTPDTNKRKKNKSPSQYVKGILKNYVGREDEYKHLLSEHLISDDAFVCMKSDNFEGFIAAREASVIEEIKRRTGAATTGAVITKTYTKIKPQTPYSNMRAIRDAIKSCKNHVFWIDKYFAAHNFDLLQDALEVSPIKKIRILSSLKSIDEQIRSKFKMFSDEVKNKGIDCQMKIMPKNISDQVHDRYLISSNISYNMVSGDTAKRGQYADITKTDINLPYKEWWNKSIDIIDDWNTIQKLLDDNK